MREITDHKINPANDLITIWAIDGPGPGGASHEYVLEPQGDAKPVALAFQKGPIAEAGVNGITNEALMAVVIDRLRSFQGSDYRCRENALAITHLEEAMHWLHHRTRARMARGVEGTSEV